MSPAARSWRPLLDGEVAAQAWAAIRAVGDHLAAAGPGAAFADRRIPARPAPDASLGSGAAGIALFLRYLSHALPGQGYDEAAASFLDAALESLSSRPLPAGLYGGLAGVAWTLRHLRELEPGDDDLAELDELLHAIVDRGDERAEYDLVSGLVGLGVYGLEALPAPFGHRFLERIVERLGELHEETTDGATWFTPPERVPDSQRHLAPDGYYNLGLAHGVPAVLVLLAGCRRAGLGGTPGRVLLDGAVGWLLGRRQEPAVGSSFPSWTGEGFPPRESRLAWCYGDPGVGAAVLTAGRAAGRADWETAGVEVLRGAARRPQETAGVRDPGLCHGSAGLGLLFDRAYQATGDQELAVAARCWYRRTVEARRPGEGVAGFRSWEPDGAGGLELRGEPGLLTGASGVALALLAAVTPVEPAWDRVLALSVPQAVAAEERALVRRAAGAGPAAALPEGPAP